MIARGHKDLSRNKEEQELQSTCLEYLRYIKINEKRIFCRKINTTGIYKGKDRYNKDVYIPNPARGMPDILAWLPPNGRGLLLEIKSHKGALNDNQKLLHSEFRDSECGAILVTIHSIDELVNLISDYKKGII